MDYQINNTLQRSRAGFLSEKRLYSMRRQLPLKWIFRDHRRDNALNFHKIRDVCILVTKITGDFFKRIIIQPSVRT